MAKRLLENWISSFLEYTASISSPEIFRKWSAYTAVSGALERRCYTVTSDSALYPNLFTLLVAKPGIGKSKAILEVHGLWLATNRFNVGPTAMTKSAFIDQLGKKPKTLVIDGKTTIYNAILVPSSEFGQLLPSHDLEFLNVLNEVYDCNDAPLRDVTQKHGDRQVDRTHMCLLAGTQPKYLSEVLPEQAYGLGFTRRIIMIYCGEQYRIELFGTNTKDPALRQRLIKDLIAIERLKGEFEWEEGAKTAAESWHKNREKDEPKHSRLASYNTTRVIHGLKLAMVVSASRGNDMVVTLQDFETAKNLLLGAEKTMGEIFKEMIVSTDAIEMEEAHEHAWMWCIHNKQETVAEANIVNFLAKRVPVTKVSYMLDLMVTAGMLKMVGANIPGSRRFKPIPKDQFGVG